MTVASTTNRKTYTGDNVTTSFATSPVIFYATSDLQVRITVIATGVSTLLTENTHYTVSGGSAAGAVGTVSLAGGSSPHGALLSTEKLVILRVLPLTQASDFVNNNNSDAEVLEAALDKLTDVDQQIQEQADRSIRFASGDVSGSVTEIPDVTTRAGRLLGFDATGLLTTFIVQVGTSLVNLAASTGASLIGFIQLGAGAVLRTLLSKVRETISVTDFGAVGDGVVNDAAAFQAAHDAAPVGAIIYAPRPSVDYLINTQLSITKGLHWVGDSSQSEGQASGTRIRSTAAIDVFNINPATDGTVHQFENFSITGGTNGMNFVRSGYISRKSFLKNLNFSTQTNAGLKTITGMIGCRHENLNFEGAGSYGIWAEGAEILDSTEWSNVHILSKTVEGFHSIGTVGKTNALSCTNLIVEHNTGRGMYLSATNVHLFNPWFEVNGSSAGAPDIYLDAVAAQGGGAFLYGGFMGANHAAQANVRVFVNADNCSYTEIGVTHSTAADIVNANDKNLRVNLFGCNGSPAINSATRKDRLITAYLNELGIVGASDLAPVVNANTGVNVTRGTFGRTISKATFATAAFTAAALTQDFTIWTTAAKTQITQVWVRVTQTFTGTAWATAVVRVGKTLGGQEYILDGTVFAGTPTYGDADAELGASISRANAVQGGDYINGSNVTLRLTTTGGNVSAITAGALEVYIETQLLP